MNLKTKNQKKKFLCYDIFCYYFYKINKENVGKFKIFKIKIIPFWNYWRHNLLFKIKFFIILIAQIRVILKKINPSLIKKYKK